MSLGHGIDAGHLPVSGIQGCPSQRTKGGRETTSYAIKGSDNPAHVERVYTSLLEGEGRIGCSNVETADLRRLRAIVEAAGWEALSKAEMECYHDSPWVYRRLFR